MFLLGVFNQTLSIYVSDSCIKKLPNIVPALSMYTSKLGIMTLKVAKRSHLANKKTLKKVAKPLKRGPAYLLVITM